MGINLNYGNVAANIEKTTAFMNGSETGKNYKKECEDALLQWDSFHDGVTSKGEFAVSNLKLTYSVFSDNDTLLEKAREITESQNDLYNAYAGEDGVISAEEYDACLQSEENGVLLDAWHDLKNQNAALNGDFDDINISRYDLNGDGKTSAKEVYNFKLNNAEKLYGKNSAEYKQIKADAKAENKLLKKGANNKNDITTEDYAASVVAANISKKSGFFAKLFDF